MYIDAEKLIKAIEEKGLDCSFELKMERLDTLALIDELQQEQPEMDLDNLTIMEEIRKCGCNPNEFDVARHFYELGKARKEEK